MSRIQKKVSGRNLAQVPVLITDTTPTSTYFRITELPEILTAGKSGFLVEGTSLLKETSKVLIEIVDRNGKTIFLQPIRDYLEGLSRFVSVEVYEDTPRGPATLTILGEAKVDLQGNPIPTKWRGVYNVKFQRNLLIDPALPNKSKVRFYNKPVLGIKEFLVPYNKITISSPTVLDSGSETATLFGITVPVSPGDETILGSFHTVTFSGSSFILDSNMVGGSLTASVNVPTGTGSAVDRVIMSSSIGSVKNDSRLVLDNPFIYSIGENTRYLSRWNTTEFRLEYDSGSTEAPSALSRSVVEIDLEKLRTFSGDVSRAKFFVKNVDNFGNYEEFADITIEQNELTVTQSFNEFNYNIQLGNFINQTHIDRYWSIFSSASGT